MSDRKTAQDNKTVKSVYDFKIAGVPYRLKTSHDESTVKELTSLVQSKVDEAIKLTKNGSFQNAAVLAAMNLAEELLLLKRKTHRELTRLEEKAILILDEVNKASHTKQDQTLNSDQI